MNYNELNEETKTFLNKTMDIYNTIKDKNICKFFKKFYYTTKYDFTKTDKKILSLFIAGFLVDGNLKQLLIRYEDIDLNNLFDFIDMKEHEILPVSDSEYEDFFKRNFEIDLTKIINIQYKNRKINFVTPELIIRALPYSTDSDILRYFAEEYDISSGMIYDHPLFEELKEYNYTNGSLTEKILEMNYINPIVNKPHYTYKIQETPQRVKNRKQKKIDDNVWQLLDEIQNKFIGQEEAAEDLFYNIVNNQQLAEMEDISDGQRSIIFMDGPTGTGKTAITREITEKLGIPFISSSVTNYSSAGYVGGDIADLLKQLYMKANGNLENAQRGIIVLDEFDKIAYSRNGRLEMKKAVQQDLLNFLGGGKYAVKIEDNHTDAREIEFDTSKLTFVCLGALTDLREEKTEEKQPLGFGQEIEKPKQKEYSITPDDLIGIGLERELVGRFNTYLHTNDYSREDLQRILTESTISPLIGFRKWIESKGKKLEVEDGVDSLVAEQAYELNTGARSLQTVMNNIRTTYIKQVLRGTDGTIKLDSETVINVGSKTSNRKGRG